jgi:glycosyltransferase involved in cell wall biosynthesis
MTSLEFPPDTGGVGESVKRISRMLTEAGHEVHVVVFHTKHRKEDAARTGKRGFSSEAQDGIHVHRYQPLVRSQANAVQEFLSDVYGDLRKLHDEQGFDVFHAFFLNETGFLTTLLAQEVERPVINSIRGADVHRNVFDPKAYSQIVWSLENSSWTTFVSRELEHRAKIIAPSIGNRTSAFWNSIMPVDFDSFVAPAMETPLSGTVIGSFGNFRNKKGVDYLIDACAELAPELDLSLLLVGDFVAKEKDYWETYVRDSGIAERIRVTGRVSRDQALTYHHLVDIFAIPSLRDGCPNALMEAMLAGKAIVGTSVDAIGEVLSHEEDALVIRPGSTRDLVAAIRRLAQEPELRQRLGAAARVKALRDLAPVREQENWLSVYNRVVESDEPRLASAQP